MRDEPLLETPVTVRTMADDLRALGLRTGSVVLVHSSLRSLSGPRSMVIGGAVALVDALREVVGREGTIVMPAFTAQNSEPSLWTNPPAPEPWWPLVREHMPPFVREETPTFRIGVVAETFRRMRGVRRSDHPQCSMAAWGALADTIVADHPLDDALGDGSPLGRLHVHDAAVLLVGADFRSCTCFHLAETRLRRPPPRVRQGAAVLRDGRRAWVSWEEPDFRTDDFPAIGTAFEATGEVRVGTVARAGARLFSLRRAVDFAVTFMDRHR